MAQHWYAMRSKPRKEEVLWQKMCAEEFEVFFPRIRNALLKINYA